jgi:plasmid stabilization system protein ParE
MSDFVLTPAAQADVLRIIDFLQGDNPSAILKVVDALDDAMQLLAENPMIGHIRRDLAGDDVRFWPVFKYLIVYQPGTKPLQVVRVLHGRRDLKALLTE